MKILIVGPYKENCQYGKLTKSLILSLNTVKADIYCRNYILNKEEKTCDPVLLSIESKPINGVDILIECLPPFLMEFDRRCGLNVGVCDLPTYPPPLTWSNKANLLDIHLNTNHIKLGNKPSFMIPIGCDINKYSLDYPSYLELEGFGKDRFLFYTIAEDTKKSGFTDIYRTILSEFNHWEQVGLVIKTSSKHTNPQKLIHKIYEDIKLVQLGIGKDRTIPVMVVTEDKYTNEQIHKGCNCYIDSDHGYDFHSNTLDAIGFGSPIIYPDLSQQQYADETFGYKVSSEPSQVYGAVDETQEGLYTGQQNWISFNLNNLKIGLRNCFEDFRRNFQNTGYKQDEKFKKFALDKIERFSYEKSGVSLLKVLTNEQQKEGNFSS